MGKFRKVKIIVIVLKEKKKKCWVRFFNVYGVWNNSFCFIDMVLIIIEDCFVSLKFRGYNWLKKINKMILVKVFWLVFV